ncbi:MAG: PAS domain-containing protein [Candidatus Micrarchaeota archaeon]
MGIVGRFDARLLDAVIEALPVEISLVDADDKVRLYNHDGKRIFPRSPSVIGRNVRDCHPPKSLDKVLAIINGFKNGSRREPAEFWINLQGKLVFIRYFPVLDENGAYVGTLEVSQDVSKIKTLEGEKRLLD